MDNEKQTTIEPTVPEVKDPPIRKCTLENVLPESTIRMLQDNPTHEVARTLALAKIKQVLPESATTFEAIREWVETTIDPSVSVTPLERNLAQAIIVNASYSYQETGCCRYTAHSSGRRLVEMSSLDLQGLINDCIDEGGDLELVIDKIYDILRDEVEEDPPETATAYSQADHDNYEATDSEDSTVDIQRSTIRTQLMTWLESNDREALNSLISHTPIEDEEQDEPL
ncbi:MAG TPA: hypothetical protein VLK33_00565 [Terriglobales bacterium]|nr:hypothetical protein [Terriglobales bacterium]